MFIMIFFIPSRCLTMNILKSTAVYSSRVARVCLSYISFHLFFVLFSRWAAPALWWWTRPVSFTLNNSYIKTDVSQNTAGQNLVHHIHRVLFSIINTCDLSDHEAGSIFYIVLRATHLLWITDSRKLFIIADIIFLSFYWGRKRMYVVRYIIHK